MSDATVIRYCAPSLAGLKTGSLFTTPFEDKSAFLKELKTLNSILSPNGLCAIPLRFYENRVLVYIYRRSALARDLARKETRKILRSLGYRMAVFAEENGAEAGKEMNRFLSALIRRMKTQNSFPHEIGLFLGYPAEDVKGFIENGASKSKYTGLWKVYGDVEKCKKLFTQYDHCVNVYAKALRMGRPFEKLIVAG